MKQDYIWADDNLYCILVGIYSMCNLIKHSLIKLHKLDYTKVNMESVCQYWMLDSQGNKNGLLNTNEYTNFE